MTKDETNAPDMVAACTDPAQAKEKFMQMGHENNERRLIAENKKKAEALEVAQKAEQQWQEELHTILLASGARKLTGRTKFWRLVFETFLSWQSERIRAEWHNSMDDLQSAILDALLYQTCEYKNGVQLYDTKKVNELLAKLKDIVA